MAQLIRGGWPYRHFPNASFKLNRWSPQSKGLVAWWPTLGSAGGNVLRDFGGRGLNGTFPGGGADPLWRIDGERGAVLHYDGNDDYIGLPSSLLDFSGPFSVSLWARFDDLTNRQVLVGKEEDEKNFAFVFVKRRNADGNVLRFCVKDLNVQSCELHGTAITAGPWYHCLATLDAANNCILYLNGVPSGGNVLGNRNDKGTLQITGRMALGWWVTIDGDIDDVRFYIYGLSPTEAYQLYANPWELYRPNIRRFAVGLAPAVVGQPMMLRGTTVPHIRQWQPQRLGR